MKTNNYIWTPEEIDLLIKLWGDKVSMADIANTIDIEPWQVKNKVQALRILGVKLTKRYKGKYGTGNYPKRPKVRKAKGTRRCLSCRNMFNPKWATNFLCVSCKNINANKSGAFD